MDTNNTQAESALVLIVEDDKFMRLQLRRAMEQVGYHVAEASDGDEGVAAYNKLHPDIVLLDALMPVVDGFTCCYQLRSQGSQVPVLMITSLDDQESVDQAFTVGATDYITKPIHWAVLRQRVRRLLQASQATADLKRQNLRSQVFAEVTLKIRQSLQLDEILQTTVTEVQKILTADRVLIYRLWPDGTGKGVTEALVPNWPSILDQTFPPEVFPEESRRAYQQGRVRAIGNAETDAEISDCLVEFLQTLHVKAKLVVPILLKDELWGLLIAHQCSSPRHWEQFDIDLLLQLANQVGIALSQAQLLEQETQQRQELARSNAELEQFVYVASHDLQEPLRMVASYLQLLTRRYKDQLDTNAEEFINYAVDGATRMQQLINALLLYSRVGTKGQEFQKIDSAAALECALQNLKIAIEESGALITQDALPEVTADSTQLIQLFQNLIANAIKFRSDRPPEIHISSHRGDGEWIFTIQDNGIGIEPQYAERIFVIFQRLHSRSEYPGTGIGLSICKKIVERHGGRIWVKAAPQKGSIFAFTLADSE